MKVERKCIVCGSVFMVQESQLKHGRGKCCSRSCASSLSAKNRASQRGEQNHAWVGDQPTKKQTVYSRRYRARHPERFSAHMAVRSAIRRGDMCRGCCEVCGNPNTEAHHDDYGEPLTVRWLCSKHHRELHNAQPE